MEISVISDNVTTIDTKHSHGLGFANSLTRRPNFTLCSPDQQRRLEICAQVLPIDAVAPPPVKPSTIPKTRTRKRARVRRRLKSTASVLMKEGTEEDSFAAAMVPLEGGNFHGFNWDESSSSPSDPAFDFVYAALSWFVLSNCLHFAFKRVVRIVVDGGADPGERRFR